MNRQDTLLTSDPATVGENTEQTLIAELRIDIRSILYGADEPMPTTAIGAAVHARGCRVPGHLVYRALVALERDTEARRAGRAGTAARSEVLWQLALTPSELNLEFERLAESVDADHAAARDAQISPHAPTEAPDERPDPSAVDTAAQEMTASTVPAPTPVMFWSPRIARSADHDHRPLVAPPPMPVICLSTVAFVMYAVRRTSVTPNGSSARC